MNSSELKNCRKKLGEVVEEVLYCESEISSLQMQNQELKQMLSDTIEAYGSVIETCFSYFESRYSFEDNKSREAEIIESINNNLTALHRFQSRLQQVFADSSISLPKSTYVAPCVSTSKKYEGTGNKKREEKGKLLNQIDQLKKQLNEQKKRKADAISFKARHIHDGERGRRYQNSRHGLYGSFDHTRAVDSSESEEEKDISDEACLHERSSMCSFQNYEDEKRENEVAAQETQVSNFEPTPKLYNKLIFELDKAKTANNSLVEELEAIKIDKVAIETRRKSLEEEYTDITKFLQDLNEQYGYSEVGKNEGVEITGEYLNGLLNNSRRTVKTLKAQYEKSKCDLEVMKEAITEERRQKLKAMKEIDILKLNLKSMEEQIDKGSVDSVLMKQSYDTSQRDLETLCQKTRIPSDDINRLKALSHTNKEGVCSDRASAYLSYNGENKITGEKSGKDSLKSTAESSWEKNEKHYHQSDNRDISLSTFVISEKLRQILRLVCSLQREISPNPLFDSYTLYSKNKGVEDLLDSLFKLLLTHKETLVNARRRNYKNVQNNADNEIEQLKSTILEQARVLKTLSRKCKEYQHHETAPQEMQRKNEELSELNEMLNHERETLLAELEESRDCNKNLLRELDAENEKFRQCFLRLNKAERKLTDDRRIKANSNSKISTCGTQNKSKTSSSTIGPRQSNGKPLLKGQKAFSGGNYQPSTIKKDKAERVREKIMNITIKNDGRVFIDDKEAVP